MTRRSLALVCIALVLVAACAAPWAGAVAATCELERPAEPVAIAVGEPPADPCVTFTALLVTVIPLRGPPTRLLLASSTTPEKEEEGWRGRDGSRRYSST